MNHSNPCADAASGPGRLAAPAVPFSWIAEVLAGPADAIVASVQLARYALSRVAGRIARRRRYRHGVHELRRLDSRILRDIGIERGRIEEVARALSERGAGL